MTQERKHTPKYGPWQVDAKGSEHYCCATQKQALAVAARLLRRYRRVLIYWREEN
jgi:hypothetical protein